MNANHIFISHATEDDEFVTELRRALEGQGLKVWVDSRNLVAGQKLDPEISRAIEAARQVLVVFSLNTVNSAWVRKEIQHAQAVEARRKDDGYRVIPLLLEGVKPTALGNWFDQAPLAVPIPLKPGGLSESLSALLAALGERLPDDPQRQQPIESQPIAELILELKDAHVQIADGKQRVTGTATLNYQPADPRASATESRRYTFTAPLGPIETAELRWYLEQYHLWPVGIFQERAKRVEEQLSEWGKSLYKSVCAAESADEPLNAWKNAAPTAERRFSVEVDSQPPEGADKARIAATAEAATLLLSLPWELLHDGRTFLFQGKNPVRVRRRFPFRHERPPTTSTLPIRVLLVSPRPENPHTGYIDHRISALPLVEAIERLGELVELTLLTPPTYGALDNALKNATEPFDVVHFDGHGVYDPRYGLGGLCFEDPNDRHKLTERNMDFISAEKMAALCRDYRIPLVFLEACQSAAEVNPTASVAAKLLEEGVASVVAMSHSVLVETARRFVTAFYRELAAGARVGAAMLAGQGELYDDANRGKGMGGVDLHLSDWFVPVLYQETQDPQLITVQPSEAAQESQAEPRRRRMGKLPDAPPQTFIGRSRELLAIERLLLDGGAKYAVVVGTGGCGKTTLAVELARWLVRSHRFGRVAFISLEAFTEPRQVLIELGQQLLPEGEEWYVAPNADLNQAMQPIERALRDTPTLLLFDNMECVLPAPTPTLPLTPPSTGGIGGGGEGAWQTAAPIDPLLGLFQKLQRATEVTRLLFTSREAMPAPFEGRTVRLGALSRSDAVELVSQVLRSEGATPNSKDPGTSEAEIAALVESVNCHARALVLLAREVARRGVTTTTENLRRLMADLHRRFGDDRENSLYASLELSLRRLPAPVREKMNVLATFHGGANLLILDDLLGIPTEQLRDFVGPLIDVGLADLVHRFHLRLDPALPAYLTASLDAAALERLRAVWGEAMRDLTGFLYQQQHQDAQLAAELTRLETPNLLAALAWGAEHLPPEAVVDWANRVETLLSGLGQSQGLANASAIRSAAAERLSQGGWTHARFTAQSAEIDRLLERGDLPSALVAARTLLDNCLAAGDDPFPEAAYDTAMAYAYLGRTLGMGGAAEAALDPLTQAQRRFEGLADGDNTNAEQMASFAMAERANCLMDLGRLDEAADAYQESIKLAKNNDSRQVAVNTGNLGAVRHRQRRFDDALKAYTEVKAHFASLGEPRSVATAWNQIGIVHHEARQFEAAEAAYRQSLAISVQEGDRPGEARSLNQLGSLYGVIGRTEEAAAFLRQAADICVELKDLAHEGVARSNIADFLIKLKRYDDARRELVRAIECLTPFGHAVGPWKAWNALHNLETATGNPAAAAEARGKAVEAYLAYRRAGGENRDPGAQLCALVAAAIQQNAVGQAESLLSQLSGADAPPWAGAMVPKLQAILRGERDPALADDPNLTFWWDAAELRLLLEGLA